MEAGIDLNMKKFFGEIEVYANLDHSDGVMNVYSHVLNGMWNMYSSYFNYISITL